MLCVEREEVSIEWPLDSLRWATSRLGLYQSGLLVGEMAYELIVIGNHGVGLIPLTIDFVKWVASFFKNLMTNYFHLISKVGSTQIGIIILQTHSRTSKKEIKDRKKPPDFP
jgi:hypothetical protein